MSWTLLKVPRPTKKNKWWAMAELYYDPKTGFSAAIFQNVDRYG